MNQRLPRWVDSRKFAHQRVELEGQIAAADLPRLRRAVSSVETPVSVRVGFDMDASGYRTVTGPLSVKVKMVCQRCMGETEVDIASDLAVGVVTSDEESRQLPRWLEPWVVDREEAEADLYSAIEDELLLDLPLVQYHDYQCIDEELYSADDPAAAEAPDEGKRNPFQVLEQLKGGKGRK